MVLMILIVGLVCSSVYGEDKIAGNEPEHAPENQSYDYAYYGMWNGAPDNWPGSFDMYNDAPNPKKAMFYNVMRDPGEKFGQLYPGLFAVTPVQNILRDHMMMIKKFPHRVSEVTPKGAELTPHG
jgi:hypothetical protein